MGRRWFGSLVPKLVAGFCCILALPAAASPRPQPMASDSAFTAMAAVPVDSLGAQELEWLRVQRRWRAELEMPRGRVSGISQFEATPALPAGRFAELAGRPYAALADSERAWLVAASAERDVRIAPSRSHVGGYAGFLLLGVVAGVILGAYAYAHALDHAFEGLTIDW